jgi:spermidine synthase
MTAASMDPDSASRRSLSLPIALLVTGASALVYQVAWGRMLRAVFGVGDLAVAAVLGAYFLGLGFGALLGGFLTRRSMRPALTYAILELFVGLYAISSLAIVPGIRDVYLSVTRDAPFGTVSLVRLGLALAVLLPPTLAMGASLPVALAAAAGHPSRWASRAAVLYAVNTIGATAGAVAAGFWLVPALGIRRTVLAAALGGARAAALVLWSFRGEVRAAEEPSTGDYAGRPALAGFLVLLGGFVSLASEVLWTRVLGLIVHGTTQAFAAMLATFLGGIAIGSALAARWLRTRPYPPSGGCTPSGGVRHPGTPARTVWPTRPPRWGWRSARSGRW